MNSMAKRAKPASAVWRSGARQVVMGLGMALVVAMLVGGCGDYGGGREPAAVVVRAADPVRLAPTKRAAVVGFVLRGMRFPVTGKAENCEFLRVVTPWWGEAWIVGPPEFAVIEGGGCADLPDASLGREAQG